MVGEMKPDLVVGEDGLARPAWAAADSLLRTYYDEEWGMPVYGEAELFERLCLEAFQAGLSWRTILAKRPAFREAFAEFSPDRVARFGEHEIQRLLSNQAIIRNRAKIEATIGNAAATVQLRTDGGLSKLIWQFRPEVTPAPTRAADVPTSSSESAALARELRSRGFRFVGPVTMYALMGAIGMVDLHLVGSHRRGTSGLWK